MFDWSKQTILLTGGTGSFGQAFARILLKQYRPKVLRIYSRDEFKQYEMQQELVHPALRYFIGDIRDKSRLKRAINGVTLVVHAAAMKQIVACEYNPTEAIQTNVLGTMNVLNVSLDEGVERVYGLITDKAVSPINLYGATKLCMEKLLIQGNSYAGKGKTKISCVRYGNVVGSRGSVIPLFLSQRNKGFVTLTDPKATRFWITMEEGVKFVIMAIESMQGGETFIPKMPSFHIRDLAEVVAPKVRQRFIGLRAGEKLHEDLINIHESRNVKELKDYYILKSEFMFWQEDDSHKQHKPFSYNSRDNQEFLAKPDIRRRLKKLGFI